MKGKAAVFKIKGPKMQKREETFMGTSVCMLLRVTRTYNFFLITSTPICFFARLPKLPPNQLEMINQSLVFEEMKQISVSHTFTTSGTCKKRASFVKMSILPNIKGSWSYSFMLLLFCWNQKTKRGSRSYFCCQITDAHTYCWKKNLEWSLCNIFMHNTRVLPAKNSFVQLLLLNTNALKKYWMFVGQNFFHYT